MKNHFLLLSLCLLASCGPGKTGGKNNAPAPLPPEVLVPIDSSSIVAQFQNTNSASAIQLLDLRLITLDGKQPSSNAINCDGTLGNSGKVNGVNPEEVRIEGNEKTGTIQFGHLAYVGATEFAACRAASKEKYTYSVSSEVLTLCNVNCINNVYPSCHASPCETFNAL